MENQYGEDTKYCAKTEAPYSCKPGLSAEPAGLPSDGQQKSHPDRGAVYCVFKHYVYLCKREIEGAMGKGVALLSPGTGDL